MPRSITAAGELTTVPEYHETPSGKLAVCAVTVTTKRRDPLSDDWVDDPPVTYQLVVLDDESLVALATMAPGDRVLFSGTLRDGAGPATIDADSVAHATRLRDRA